MNSLFSNNSPLWNLTNKILNFLWLSLLWFLCSLPVITVGASTAALYQVMLKYVRNEEGYLTTSYFRAFRRNFRQATAVWLLLLPAGLLLTINFVLYNRLEQEGTAGFLFMILGFGVSLSFAFMNLYVYAVLAKFQNTLFRIITNSWIMALYHWPTSVLMLAITLLILASGFLIFPPLLFCAPAVICYLNTKQLTRIFEKYTATA